MGQSGPRHNHTAVRTSERNSAFNWKCDNVRGKWLKSICWGCLCDTNENSKQLLNVPFWKLYDVLLTLVSKLKDHDAIPEFFFFFFFASSNLMCFRLFEMCKRNNSTTAVAHHERTAALDLDFAYDNVSYICFALLSQQIVSVLVAGIRCVVTLPYCCT